MIDEKAVAVINNEALSIKQEAKSLKIIDLETAQKANDMLSRSKSWFKATKSERDAALKPVKDRVKKINDVYAPGLDAIEEAIKILDDLILLWIKSEEERKDSEEKARITKLAEIEAAQETASAADAFDIIAEKEAIVSAPVEDKKAEVRSDYGSSSITRRWTYEITDAAFVPRVYCEPDASLIRTAVNGGTRAIPGVRIFQTESVTTRR